MRTADYIRGWGAGIKRPLFLSLESSCKKVLLSEQRWCFRDEHLRNVRNAVWSNSRTHSGTPAGWNLKHVSPPGFPGHANGLSFYKHTHFPSWMKDGCVFASRRALSSFPKASFQLWTCPSLLPPWTEPRTDFALWGFSTTKRLQTDQLIHLAQLHS